MKKVIIAVGIIAAIIVLFIGAQQGSKAYYANQAPKNTAEVVDRIIALQAQQQEVIQEAQKRLTEKGAPIDNQLISMLRRLNMTDRKKYELVMKNYFPKVEKKDYLPDPNAPEKPAGPSEPADKAPEGR